MAAGPSLSVRFNDFKFMSWLTIDLSGNDGALEYDVPAIFMLTSDDRTDLGMQA